MRQPRLAGGEQGGGVAAQAVVETEPGQRSLLVAEQQPLSGVAGHRGRGAAAQVADEGGLADAQAAAFHQAFEAQSRMACDAVGGLRRTAEGAGDGVFGTVLEGGGEGQAAIRVEIAQG